MSARSREQVLALVSDPSSVRAGRSLATAARWAALGHDDDACWGECAGSGQQPYRTQVASADGASRCSCPSRRFPCKHAIGLMLLDADGQVGEAGRPAWVQEWLDTRTQHRAARAPDPEAAAKRAEARNRKVDSGVAELRRWLEDLARGGLAQAQTQPWSWWDAAAKRMVDAQAKGLSSRIYSAARTAAAGSHQHDWPSRLLDQVGGLHLLAAAWSRRETLDPETRRAMATRIGATTATEEVLARGERVTDSWTVVSSRVTDDGGLQTLQQWLRGRHSGRTVVYLAFAAGPQPPAAGLAPGMTTEAELALYPGTRPQRALVVRRIADPAPAGRVEGAGSWHEALPAVAQALAVDPWCETVPLAVDGVTVVPGPTWLLRDRTGHALPLDAVHWPLLSLSEGSELDVVAEWDGFVLRPTAAARSGRSLELLP